jgi:hypothetical protein
MTPSGMEPATFLFVAQYFNHRATAVPLNDGVLEYILNETKQKKQDAYKALQKLITDWKSTQIDIK